MIRRLALLGFACVTALALATTAEADSVYWGSQGTNLLSHAALGGGSGGSVAPTPIAADGLAGSVLDSATGKIYWANAKADTISFSNLDGSGSANLNTAGATVDEPTGLTIDTANGRLYWADAGADKISWASLNGTGGGDLNTTGAPVDEPKGIVAYPASGRVYWTNYAGDSIGYANLDGSGGGGKVSILAEEIDGPDGIGIYANYELFWTNRKGGGSIGFASLDLFQAGEFETAGTFGTMQPVGVAIDTEANTLYWADESQGRILSATVTGGDEKTLDTAGADASEPSYPFIIKAPRASGFPTVTGNLTVGSTLTCNSPAWEPDLPESFFYREPQSLSYRWEHNGVPQPGATSPTLVATEEGSYGCWVTGTNAAGSTTTGPGYGIGVTGSPKAGTVTLTKVRLDRRHGTATVLVQFSKGGTLALSGKNVAARSVTRSNAGTAKLKVVAKGKGRKALVKTGKLKVRVTVRLEAGQGATASASRSITLRRHLGAA